MTQITLPGCLSLLASFAVSAVALGGNIHVSKTVGGGSPVTAQYGSGDPIIVTIPDTAPVLVRVWADDPANDDVGHITLDDLSATSYVVTLVFADSGGYSSSPVSGVCRNWAGLTNPITRGTRLSGHINGSLTGSVAVSKIGRFEVSGSLAASLSSGMDAEDEDAEFITLVAGSFATSGEAKANAEDIGSIQVAGSMLGDLRAPNGTIFKIEVGGDIGSPARLSTITGRVDALHPFKEAFELISADNIYANISATAETSWLGRLETTGSPGDFVGSLFINHINWEQTAPVPGVYLLGDLDADMTLGSVSAPIEIGGDLTEGGSLVIDQTMRTDTVDRTGHVYIGGSLLGTIEIGQSVAKGVQGFIEINTNNASGVWAGDVNVRTPNGIETLEATMPQVHPAYSQLSSEITESGYYGAVGLVPFRLHANDCTPPNGACVSRTETPDTDDEILMRHYGPVYWSGSTPFVISFRGIGDTTWHDVTDCFDQSPAGDPSVVIIQPQAKLRVGCEYLVELRQDSGVNVLRCNLAASTPPVADHTSPFILTVGAASPGDANDDGIVNFEDINANIANWQSTACFPFGDADHDGDVDFVDIDQIIANWLSEYEDCSSGMMMMAGFGEGCDRDLDDAIAAMGFENATEYAVFLAGLSNDERAMILAAVDEWLECQR